MVTSCGYSIERTSSYDWHGLRRGKAEFVLFQYTISGRGVLEYEGDRFEAEPGKALVLHFPHNNRYFLPKGWEPWEFVFICLSGSECQRIFRHIEQLKGPLVTMNTHSATLKCLSTIINLAIADKLNSPYRTSLLAYEFCMSLSGELLCDQRSIRPRSVELVRQYIREKFAQPLTANTLAALAGYSRSHFSRIFSQSEGETLEEHIINVRIEEATRLLHKGNMSVKEIAFACGFLDASYFSKLYKNRMGISPGSIRKSGMF